MKVTGERGANYFSYGNICMPPESKSAAKEIQRKFGEIAVGIQKYKGQGEVVLVGDFNSRIGKASNPMRTMGNMGK